MKLSALGDGVLPIGVMVGLYASAASSAIVSHTVGESDDIRFQWGVPEASASSGSGDVYFQLAAPDSYAWVGLGIGQRMRGAQIFLMYQDGDGGVTLSTREGVGHVMPEYVERADFEVLEGSGVANGTMRANVRCGSCDDLDLSGTNGWITAWKSGEPLDSSSVEAQITFHDSMTVFQVDFADATISSNSNPFLGNDGESSDDDNSAADGDDNDSDGAIVEDSSDDKPDTIMLAHGVIMTLVFAGLYPLGSSLMLLLGKWYIHAAWQAVAYLLMWAGFGLGSWFANHDDVYFDNPHTALGTIVVILLAIQPVFGWLHHAHYRKVGKRGTFSYIHVWYGRVLILLGIINGGLGLLLADRTSGAWLIAYCVVAAVVPSFYLSSIVFSFFRRPGEANRGPSKAVSEGQIPAEP